MSSSDDQEGQGGSLVDELSGSTQKSTLATAFFQSRKWPYYGRVFSSLACGLKNPEILFKVLLGRKGILHFKSGFSLQVLCPLDLLVAAEVILLDCYQIKNRPPPKRVIDVGGALGEFGLFVAHRFRSAQVAIFEPSPASFELLEQNAALNRLDNISLHQACVGLEPTYDFPASSSPQNSILTGEINCVQVPGIRLEEFIDQEVDILKVDTEGFEIPVLMSAGSRLERVHRVCLEYHEPIVPGQRRALEQLLSEAGFVVTTLPDRFNPAFGLIFASNRRTL